jgi:hypothetical protein
LGFKGLFLCEGARLWKLLLQYAERGDQVLFLGCRGFSDRDEMGDEIMAALEDVAIPQVGALAVVTVNG